MKIGLVQFRILLMKQSPDLMIEALTVHVQAGLEINGSHNMLKWLHSADYVPVEWLHSADYVPVD